MIHLAVGYDTIREQEISIRIRDATIETGWDFAKDPPPSACDAVLFLDSSHLSQDAVLRCLSDRKHVLLDVGSWLSADSLEVLAKAAAAARVVLSVVNADQYLPSRQLIRQQLSAGTLGVPGLLRLHRWEPYGSRKADGVASLPWPLIRDLEFSLSILGDVPDLVYALKQTPKQLSLQSPGGVDESPGHCLLVHLGFAGGAAATLDYSNALPPGDDYVSLSVIGSHGAAYADDHQNMQLVYQGGSPRAVRGDERGRQYATMVQEFVTELNAGRDCSASTDMWRNVLRLANTVRKSLESGQAESVVRAGRFGQDD